MARDVAGVEGSQFYRDLQRGKMSYRMVASTKVVYEPDLMVDAGVS
jgi:hypothetical protein